MAQGDIYQVVLNSTFMAQQMRNVFHFYQTFVMTDYEAAENLAVAVTQKLFPAANAGLRSTFIVSAVSYNGLDITNLYNDDIFINYTTGYPYVGGQGIQEAMPPFVAYELRSNRLRGDIRRGFKRFSGLPENYGQGGALDSGVRTLIQAQLGDPFADKWTAQATPDDEWHLVVVKRIEYTTDKGNRAYRLPANQMEGDFFRPTEWDVQPRVTTQNSRKIGRGI
jgi:hypothetical protein